ncbi:MAG: YdeI/OmpD-associated family protein [Bacteroidia bacterium]|nr:YdeI/OmpD-associated family protein [Bacteroidia bacterium]
MEAIFFESAVELRRWFMENHLHSKELWVGIYKKEAGRPSVSWGEVKDEILCFGWAEGRIQPIDNLSYGVRLTPRKPKSKWSTKNIEKAGQLIDLGLMEAAGIKAFEERDKNYEKEQAAQARIVELPSIYLERLKANPRAWQFFEQVAPSYKKSAIRWIMSAKQEATRDRRVEILIESSEEGLRVPPLRPRK